jgi:hypothetical protein
VRESNERARLRACAPAALAAALPPPLARLVAAFL